MFFLFTDLPHCLLSVTCCSYSSVLQGGKRENISCGFYYTFELDVRYATSPVSKPTIDENNFVALQAYR